MRAHGCAPLREMAVAFQSDVGAYRCTPYKGKDETAGFGMYRPAENSIFIAS